MTERVDIENVLAEFASLWSACTRDRAAHGAAPRLYDQCVRQFGVLMLCIFRQNGISGCATLPFTDHDQMSWIVKILDDDVAQVTNIRLHVLPDRLGHLSPCRVTFRRKPRLPD